jgi:hypothetical protein
VVFADGKYISAPYVVSSVEGDIFINGTHVMTALKWPPPVKDVREPPETLPLLPPTITEHTTPYDKDYMDYVTKASWYLTSKYGYTKGLQLLVGIYTNLPCVRHAYLTPDNRIVVTWNDNEVMRFHHSKDTPVPEVTRDQALRHVDRMANIFVENLKKDHYFVFGRGTRMGTRGGYVQTFTPLADAMRLAGNETEFLSIMKTNQPPGGMSDTTLRLFYRFKDDLPRWDPRRPASEHK